MHKIKTMALQNINPTKTKAWKKLTNHFNENKNISIKDLYKNSNRQADFSIEFDDLLVDFSKNKITQETIDLLVELANEVDLKDAMVVVNSAMLDFIFDLVFESKSELRLTKSESALTIMVSIFS